MKACLDWSLDVIRKDGPSFSWMEERNLEWVPLVVSRIQNLLNGKTFVVFTDIQREWFRKYILSSVNRATNERPFLPFVSLSSFFPHLHSIRSNEDINLLEDMLSIAFPAGYIFFYIGSSTDIRSQIAKRKDNSFIWLFDEKMQNTFYLNSKDKNLDIKLIQLYGLLDKTIDALLCAEISNEDE